MPQRRIKKQTRSIEARAKTSVSLLKYWREHPSKVVSKASRQRMSMAQRKRFAAGEHPWRGKSLSLEHRAKISKSRKDLYAAGYISKKQLRSVQRKSREQPSLLEIQVAKLLRQGKLKYTSQFIINRYVVDFYLYEYRLCIECDGKGWHGMPGRKERDYARDQWLVDSGYRVVHLVEEELKQDELVVLAIIKAAILKC